MTIHESFAGSERQALEFEPDYSSAKPSLKTMVVSIDPAGGRLIVGVSNALYEEERLYSLVADNVYKNGRNEN